MPPVGGTGGKPALCDPFALLEDFQNAPEAGEGEYAEQCGSDCIRAKQRRGERHDSGQQECPPDPHSEIKFALDHDRMENPDDQKTGQADYDSVEIYGSFLLCD